MSSQQESIVVPQAFLLYLRGRLYAIWKAIYLSSQFNLLGSHVDFWSIEADFVCHFFYFDFVILFRVPVFVLNWKICWFWMALRVWWGCNNCWQRPTDHTQLLYWALVSGPGWWSGGPTPKRHQTSSNATKYDILLRFLVFGYHHFCYFNTFFIREVPWNAPKYKKIWDPVW